MESSIIFGEAECLAPATPVFSTWAEEIVRGLGGARGAWLRGDGRSRGVKIGGCMAGQGRQAVRGLVAMCSVPCEKFPLVSV